MRQQKSPTVGVEKSRTPKRACDYAVNIMGKYYVSKQSIINYLATDKAFKNTQKTPWHIAVIERFFEKS